MKTRTLRAAAYAACTALAAVAAVAFASDYPFGPLPGLPETRTAPYACLDYCAIKEQCSVGWPSVTVESPYPTSPGWPDDWPSAITTKPPYPPSPGWPDGCASYCLAICSPLVDSRPDTGLRIGFLKRGE